MHSKQHYLFAIALYCKIQKRPHSFRGLLVGTEGIAVGGAYIARRQIGSLVRLRGILLAKQQGTEAHPPHFHRAIPSGPDLGTNLDTFYGTGFEMHYWQGL